jgi:hypothetical protein
MTGIRSDLRTPTTVSALFGLITADNRFVDTLSRVSRPYLKNVGIRTGPAASLE